MKFSLRCASVPRGGPIALFGLFVLLGGMWATEARAEVPKPGTVITKDNMDQYLEVLAPTWQWELKQGSKITVQAYEKWEWPKAYREATEKYASQVKIAPDGRSISNYVAGAPFPTVAPDDPLAPFKWMWNFEFGPQYTDNYGCGWNYQLINSSGGRDRYFGSNFWRRMKWKGRLYMDPKPEVPHDPEFTYTEQWGPTHDPPDLKGAGVLNFRYTKNEIPDDSYMYLPELRKVRRLSAANRSDAFWGSDGDIDSVKAFNAKIGFWNFKILDEKQMLMPANSRHYGKRDIWCAEPDGSRGMLAHVICTEMELRPIIIIEAVPTGYTQYAFSKRVLYLDKEIRDIQLSEGYDHGGKLWKQWYHTFERGKTPAGDAVDKPHYDESVIFYEHGSWHDFQMNHSSNWDCPDGYLYPNLGIKHWYVNEPKPWNNPDTFTVNYLIKSAGF